MQINRLRVKNFRSFAENEWKFASGFNVLIGNNGAGKSGVLEALKIAVGSFFLGIDGVPCPGIRVTDIRYTITRGEDRSFRDDFFPVEIEAEGWFQEQKITWQRELYGKKRNITYGGAKELKLYASQLQKQARNGDRTVVFPLITYYGAGRLFRQLQDRASRPITPKEVTYAYHAALAAESDFDYQLASWRTRALANHGRIRGTPLLDALYDAVTATLGEEWREIAYDFDYGDILVLTPDEEWHPISSLSDGQRTVVAMALDMAYRSAILNPSMGANAPKETAGVALIDELDLHLHPEWQRELVGNLRRAFPRVQFIVSTHSPIIIQNLQPELDCVIDLSGGEFPLSERSSPEDILARMGVDIPQRSQAWLRLFRAAERYYSLLDRAKNAQQNHNPEELNQLRQELDIVSIPFEDNPAWAALLERKRVVAGIDPEDIEA